METINYEAIIHPNEALEMYKPYLLEQYISEYGEEYQELIEGRMAKTIYLFESTPTETMTFLRENSNCLNNTKALSKAEEEYNNYLKVKNIIERTLKSKLYNEIAKYFNITSSIRYEEIVDLDFEAFSIQTSLLLEDKNVSKKVKERILKRQKNYLEQCKLYGLEPITDHRVLGHIIRYKEGIEKQAEELLVKYTKWGRRISKIINKKSPIKYKSDVIASLIFNKETATTNIIANQKDQMVTICYLPLARNMKIQELDRIFFHENRHVIEVNDRKTGIVDENDTYCLLNEIRTEKNAGLDARNLEGKLLFSNAPMSKNNYNSYQELFPYTGKFFETFHDELNEIAINSNIDELEALFGKNNLSDFTNYLKKIQYYFKINQEHSSLPVDIKKQKQMIYRLKESYQKNR